MFHVLDSLTSHIEAVAALFGPRPLPREEFRVTLRTFRILLLRDMYHLEVYDGGERPVLRDLIERADIRTHLVVDSEADYKEG